MRVLYEAHAKGIPHLGGDYILAEAECESRCLSDVFKGSSAWGTLVVPGDRKGTYTLNIPLPGQGSGAA